MHQHGFFSQLQIEAKKGVMVIDFWAWIVTNIKDFYQILFIQILFIIFNILSYCNFIFCAMLRFYFGHCFRQFPHLPLSKCRTGNHIRVANVLIYMILNTERFRSSNRKLKVGFGKLKIGFGKEFSIGFQVMLNK